MLYVCLVSLDVKNFLGRMVLNYFDICTQSHTCENPVYAGVIASSNSYGEFCNTYFSGAVGLNVCLLQANEF